MRQKGGGGGNGFRRGRWEERSQQGPCSSTCSSYAADAAVPWTSRAGILTS